MRRGQVVAVETLIVTVTIILVSTIIATYIIVVSLQARSQPEVDVLGVNSVQFVNEDGSMFEIVIEVSVYSRGTVDSRLDVITLFDRSGSVDLSLASATHPVGTDLYIVTSGSATYYVELKNFNGRVLEPFSSSTILITVEAPSNPYVEGVSYLGIQTFNNYFTWFQYTPLET